MLQQADNDFTLQKSAGASFMIFAVTKMDWLGFAFIVRELQGTIPVNEENTRLLIQPLQNICAGGLKFGFREINKLDAISGSSGA